MPTLAENLSNRLVLKAHTSTTYDATAVPDISTDPGSSGGQIWRHVSHNLALPRDNYTANEKRQDQVQPIAKLGTKRVPVTTNHLLSCSTHYLALEACLQGTWTTAVVTADQTDFTSVRAVNSTSVFEFGGGNPATAGFRVGDVIQFSDLSEADNNSKDFIILSMGGTSNREVTVYPAPEDMTADSAFSVTTRGRSLFAPTSSLVSRKYVLETYTPDSDIAKVYSDIRFGGFDLSIAPNQMTQINFAGMGRDREVFSGGSAPFFGSPTAETTTDVISSMDGLLRLNGSTLAVATGFSLNWNKALSAPAVVNSSGLSAGVVATANAVVSGQFTVFEVDTAFHTLYDAGTEFEFIGYFPESDSAGAPNGMVFFLPRVKITNMTETEVDGGLALQCEFSASRYFGSGGGIESTALRIVDTTLTLSP
ncbi:MAG: phage tail tube protein [Bradyrhizobium sp.]|uniref:phage tail tube protein n=1 Tax=Bradyrhizobium sp. TaxID=376 RepID=UPI003D14C1AD